MAEGFDDMEIRDGYGRYSNEELDNMADDIFEKTEILSSNFGGVEMSPDAKKEFVVLDKSRAEIQKERHRRRLNENKEEKLRRQSDAMVKIRDRLDEEKRREQLNVMTEKQNRHDEEERRRQLDVIVKTQNEIDREESRDQFVEMVERRDKTDEEKRHREELAETSFTDNDDGKTVTIAKGETSLEVPDLDIPAAPKKSDTATFKRAVTMDKKEFIRKILGAEVKAGNGPYSKDLLLRLSVDPSDGSAEFDDARIFVRKEGGIGLTGNKKMQPKVDEFNKLLKEAQNERGLPTVDTTPSHTDIRGLTKRENREMRGVLEPSSSILRESRIGDGGALQIHADDVQRSLNEINEMMDGEDIGSVEELELRERAAGLEEARDKVLEQRNLEEVRERQEEDIDRLEQFKEWVRENWLGASALAAGVASLIATIVVGARTVAVRGAQATKSFANAVRNAIKKLGPWAVPLANFLYTLLKGGAAVVGWLASNLWVVVLSLLWFVYDYNKT